MKKVIVLGLAIGILLAQDPATPKLTPDQVKREADLVKKYNQLKAKIKADRLRAEYFAEHDFGEWCISIGRILQMGKDQDPGCFTATAAPSVPTSPTPIGPRAPTGGTAPGK